MNHLMNGENSRKRIEKFAVAKRTGECIMLGNTDPVSTLMQMIVDDGLKSRSNRRRLFDGKYKHVGFERGPHRKYGTITVICFATELFEKEEILE